jgi:heme/copper-type cytochrome/quinol oxidase subunit 2
MGLSLTLQQIVAPVKNVRLGVFARVARVGFALCCLLPRASAGEPRPVGNIFKPLSAPAESVYEASLLVLLISAAIFLVVAGLLTIAIIKFRARPGDEGKEPPQIYGSNQLELAWTVIPILIVVVLVLVTARTIADVQNHAMPAGAIYELRDFEKNLNRTFVSSRIG